MNKQAQVQFVQVELLTKSINVYPNPKPDLDYSKIAYNFNVKAEAKLDIPKKLMVYLVEVEIRDPETQQMLATVSAGNIFQIENFSEVITPNADGGHEVPFDLDSLLRTISVSTMRGIMYSEFRGTYLQPAVLPIIMFTPETLQRQMV